MLDSSIRSAIFIKRRHELNRKAIVTGGASGIGAAISRRFAQEGALVAVCDIDLEGAKKIADEIKGHPYRLDVSNYKEVEKTISEIAQKFGTIHILVNNAGINRDTLLLRMSEEDWDRVLSVNLKGAFNCSKAVIRYMMKERWGRIINISSIVGLVGNPGQANYVASKAGLIGFAKSLAKELAPRNITVNVVAPGYIDTPMTQKLPEDIKEQYLKAIPLKRLGKPEDVAELCLFLASDKASYITGEVIGITGGLIV